MIDIHIYISNTRDSRDKNIHRQVVTIKRVRVLNAFKKVKTERGWKEDIERDRRWQWSRYRRVSRIYPVGQEFYRGRR